MAPERQPSDIRLTGIHINLIDQVVTLEAADGKTAKLSFGQPKTLFEAHQELIPQLPAEADEPAPEPEVPATQPETREKQPTVVLSGRLRTKPKEGRPDNQGRATAWGRLAVHEDGAEQAHLFSATFHRRTAAIALGLDRGAQLTVEGYPHAGDAARKRLDTLSVIAVHQYPGKPESQRRRAVKRE